MNKYQMFDALKKYKDKQNNKTELNSMDSFMHAGTSYNHYQSNQPGYYAKLEDFWGKGKHRYFYTKAEWDAYNKNKQAAQNTGADRAAKEKENAAKKTPVEQAQSGREAAIKQAQENEKKRKEEEYLKKAQEAGKKAEEERKRQTEALRNMREEKRKAYLENFQKNAAKAEEERKNREAEVKKEAEEIKRERDEALKNGNYPKWYQEHHKAEINENSEKMRNDPNSPLNLMTSVQDYETPNGENWDYSDQIVQDASTDPGALYVKLNENDKKIQDTYDWIENNKETEETDPKTGLKIKNYELLTEEEMKLVNPGYYCSDQYYDMYILYGYDSPSEYANNCYACTQAMALRKQGYDVNAGADLDGIYASGKDPEIGVSYEDLWTGKFTDYKDYKSTKNSIQKEPVGSYGDFNWSYNDGSGWCGHSIFYEVKADGVHYYDCQNGQEYSEQFIQDIMSSAARYTNGTSTFTSRYKRLDNQEFKGTKKMKEADKLRSTEVKPIGGLEDEKE